jgi:hypothetical protein
VASDHWFKELKQSSGTNTIAAIASLVEHALYGIFVKLESCVKRLDNADVPKLIRRGIDERVRLLNDIIDVSIRYDEEIEHVKSGKEPIEPAQKINLDRENTSNSVRIYNDVRGVR